MGAFNPPPAPEPWGMFESPHSRVPQYRSLAPIEPPWLFRTPNRALFVLLGMLAPFIAALIWIANVH